MSGCTLNDRHPVAPTTVFPSHTIFPSEVNIPDAIVSDMPRRINRLSSRRVYSVKGLMSSLGLSRYQSNLSANMRWNHYFVYLNQDQILYLEIDIDSMKDDLPFQADQNAHVVRVELRKNPDQTVIAKDLHSNAEQGAAPPTAGATHSK